VKKLKLKIFLTGIPLYLSYFKLEVNNSKKDYKYEYEQNQCIEYAEKWMNCLLQLNANHPQVVGVPQAFEDAKGWKVAEQKRKKEEEENRQAELERVRKEGVQVLLEKYKNPYTGGSLSCGTEHWTYSANGSLVCNTGQFSGWKAEYQEYDRRNTEPGLYISFEQTDTTPNSLGLYLWDTGLIRLSFNSISIQSCSNLHNLWGCQISEPMPEFGRKFEVTGSVPIPVIFCVTGLVNGIKAAQQIIIKDKKRLKIIRWKEERVRELRNSIDTCRGCNCNGDNWRFCPNCERFYCTNTDKYCFESGRGSNVCTFCSKYDGMSKDISINDLKNRRDDDSNFLLIVEEYWRNNRLSYSEFPPWAQFLENYREQ